MAVRVEEARVAAKSLNGFVHDDDPTEAHGFQILIREHLANQAGHFGVGLGKPALLGFGTNLLGDTIVISGERTREDRDLGSDA